MIEKTWDDVDFEIKGTGGGGGGGGGGERAIDTLEEDLDQLNVLINSIDFSNMDLIKSISSFLLGNFTPYFGGVRELLERIKSDNAGNNVETIINDIQGLLTTIKEKVRSGDIDVALKSILQLGDKILLLKKEGGGSEDIVNVIKFFVELIHRLRVFFDSIEPLISGGGGSGRGGEPRRPTTEPARGSGRRTPTRRRATSGQSKKKYDFNVTNVTKRFRKTKIGKAAGFTFRVSNDGNTMDDYKLALNVFRVIGTVTKGEEDKFLKEHLLTPPRVGWERTSRRTWPQRHDTGDINPNRSIMVLTLLDIPKKLPDKVDIKGRYMIELTATSKSIKGKGKGKSEHYFLDINK